MSENPNAERNVYQRKLAVMAKCDAIKPDKFHEGHKYHYCSVQTISNHLRKFAAEEGLDIDVHPDEDDPTRMVVELVNVDDPGNRISHTWPIVSGDKGWAYSTKYPLVRTFLIGDGEENDESDMSNRSAEQTKAAAKGRKSDAAPPAQMPASNGQPADLSAKDLADRGPLYDLATKVGSSQAWVDSALDGTLNGKVYSIAGVRKALESQAVKAAKPPAAPQDPPKPAEEPKAEQDPNELVCPVCGKAAALMALTDEKGDVTGRVRCVAGKGGCANTFDQESQAKRGDWLRWQEEAKANPQPAETSKLEQLVDEAGVRPSDA